MTPSRIRLSYSRDEKTPPNIFSDHDWVRHNETELLEKYGERFIVVFQEEVLGVGDTYESALEDAEKNLPPEITEATPVVELLHHRHPEIRGHHADSRYQDIDIVQASLLEERPGFLTVHEKRDGEGIRYDDLVAPGGACLHQAGGGIVGVIS